MAGTGSSSSSLGRVYGPRELEDDFDMGYGEYDESRTRRVLSKIKSLCRRRRCFEDDFDLDGSMKNESRRRVLAKIDSFYRQRRAYLKLEDYMGTGFCFGLLDPASNVVINSVMSYGVEGRRGAYYEEEYALKEMTRRSLDGLVAFLTRLFPYLPDAEALRYLAAAEADPIVASQLVIKRRGAERSFMADSRVTVAAVEAALMCAAVAARHPDPRRLVLGWTHLSYSPSLSKLASMISQDDTWGTASYLLRHVPGPSVQAPAPLLSLEGSWELASSRLVATVSPGRQARLPPARGAVKRMLLATIHGFYLQALARLPTAELQSRYHRSMLVAGHCYGPLDPVSNIIVNTVWYHDAFVPKSKEVTMRMMSTKGLNRVAARSLYGFVSFLCTRYPGLTPDLALERLHAAGADLRIADPNLDGTAAPPAAGATWRDRTLRCWSAAGCFAGRAGQDPVEGNTPSAGLGKAYAAAAAAARHPEPIAQQELFGSPDEVAKLKDASSVALRDGGQLSSKDLERLSRALLECCPSYHSDPLQEPAPRKLNKTEHAFVTYLSNRFRDQQEKLCCMVEAALDAYNKQPGVPEYRLHVICGVNESCSHMNFLATCKDSQSPAVLFFAECSAKQVSLCCPVSTEGIPGTEQVRCIYCEHECIRVVHPAAESFSGRDRGFEEASQLPLFCRSQRRYNAMIIADSDCVGSLFDDFIYCGDYAAAEDGEEQPDGFIIKECSR